MGASDIARWLDIHPHKNPDAQVWIGLQTKKPVKYDWAARLLRELTRKAGINKKCNPHLYRHSAATHYAPKLTEQVMNAHFGWEQGGRTVATYTHLSGKQVDDQILAMHGKKKIEDGKEILEGVSCPRCKKECSPVSVFCGGCGFALRDQSAAEALDRKKQGRQDPQHRQEIP